jgi:hypothetical protein
MCNKKVAIVILAGVLFGVVIGSAYAQDLGTVTFNENGNISWNGTILPNGTQIPGGGALYDLSSTGLSFPATMIGQAWGWTELASTNIASDVIVFGGIGGTTNPNPSQFQFYSDPVEDPMEIPEMADLTDGILISRFPNAIIQGQEIGPEGNNFVEFLVQPASGGPFFTMHGVSDVPEPNTLVLLAAAAIGLLIYARRRMG